jgi:phage terminase small subunit
MGAIHLKSSSLRSLTGNTPVGLFYCHRKKVMIVASKKQERFVEEYLIDLNAKQAAIRAGYKPNNADVVGYQLLQKTSVKNAIEKAMAERSRRTGISQDRVLYELAKMAFVNISDVVDLDNASVKEDAAEEDLACIQSVKIKPNEFGTEREVKMYDKKASLELLGRHLGMFKDNVKLDITPVVIGGDDGLED